MQGKNLILLCLSAILLVGLLLVTAYVVQQEGEVVDFHASAVMKTRDVAFLHVETNSGKMEYVHNKKGSKESGTYALYTRTDMLNSSGTLESIRGRGNYTWSFTDKKPYSITLSEEADLLGMGAAKEWILLANATDPTHLRNKMIFDFADAVGLPYSPQARWVNLYLNGEYAGLYLLCERNEVHPERVDIAQQGSFLISLELEERIEGQGIPYVNTASGLALRIRYPETPVDSDKTALKSVWQSAENAILAEDGIDPVSGKSYLELIDLDSWARKYLIEEIFGNLDGCFLSQYFYYDGSEGCGKIYAGPVWDYDLSMGNKLEWQLADPNSLFADRLQVKDGITSPWFHALWQKQAFRDYALGLYQTEFLPLLKKLLESGINSYAMQIELSSKADSVRWSADPADVAEQTAYLKAYMEARIAFLNSLWIDEVEYCYIRINDGLNTNYAYRTVSPGSCLKELPVLKDTEISVFLGWYHVDTDKPFDISQPIYEDTAIYAKWQSNPQSNWKKVLKLAPLGVIAVLGLGLLAIDLKRWRKYG